MSEKTYTVVIGGANIDRWGTPFKPLVARDSNPGRVYSALGGVGRNAAHNMALLGLPVEFITALGDDSGARRVENSCRELGIGTGHSLRQPGGNTSTYLFISNHEGEMELAVSDMVIYDALTPSYIAKHLDFLNEAALVVVDANIPAETIAYIAERCTAPVFFDPVSTAKGEKARPVLGKLHTLKPNRLEAESLSGVKITDDASLKEAADKLLSTGLKRVYISLGEQGAYCADKSSAVRLPCCPGHVVNATGCGDAFMAALAWGYWHDLSLEDTGKAALAAAAVALAGDETINPKLSGELVRKLAGLG